MKSRKRKLASIQLVSKLEQIENADRILKATVMGWSLVVRKGEFEVGDRCVFFEIDSILPETNWSEFMRSKKFRVKTCKLRGIFSQGLALPISILGGKNPKRNILDKILGRDGWNVGTDVTDYLGVKKFDIEVVNRSGGFKSGQKLGNFPSFIPKTDEIRIQSDLQKLERINGKEIYITTKCDGTSSTFYKDDSLVVCSRNRKVAVGNNVYWDMASKYRLDNLPPNFAVQGEICGPGIQKNFLCLKQHELFVFDIFHIKSGKYLNYLQLVDFCKDYNLQMVPINCVCVVDKSFDNSLNAWLERAKGKYEGTNYNREGIVVRTTKGRLSFKVINNDYLLKEED